MLECALYSYVSTLKEIEKLRSLHKEEVFNYNVFVYTKDDTLIIVESSEKYTKIIKKKQTDKNKNRKHVVHVVEISEANTLDNLIKLLDMFGYKCKNKTNIQEHLFTLDSFYVSVSKETDNETLETDNLDKFWLVKAFSLSDNLQNAEQIFNVNISKLEGFFEFKKTEIKYFDG